eukprot:TRINITY_DN327_c0_g1_i1.p1 TRINITY_DN327_c0_g1~~TRINITY_DN327_c0_g1_i1.p1  ORF type:complete len:748 (+),score=87.00 TRINITY_DN327_c0_g1_i1:87-2330(+)
MHVWAVCSVVAAQSSPPVRAMMGNLHLPRTSSVSRGNLLPAFLFLQGESDGLDQSLSLAIGGGRGRAIPFVPDDSCDDAIFEGASPDLRSPQLPYSRQDRWGCERVPANHTAIVLESGSLRAKITPQWGGKVWSLFDKKAGKEFFYANEAHQPANIGARGAWAAGGLEFNWSPGYLGHSAFTEEGVWTARLPTPRGDVVRSYEYDRYNGTVWQVDVFVEGNELWTHSKVTNPRTTDSLAYWWTCAAHRATPGTRVVAPAKDVTVETYVGSGLRNAPFPHFANGLLNSTLGTREVDSSFLGNIAYTGDYFLRVPESSRRWIAHVDEAGYAAMHGHPMNGTKFFTWGQSGPGRYMQDFLGGGVRRTGDYVELQSGVTPTQQQVFTLSAKSTYSFTEYFKALPNASSTLQGSYDSAVATLGTWWDSQDGIPESRVQEMDAFFKSIEDQTPLEANLLTRGTPWGAIEEAATGAKLAPGTLFVPTQQSDDAAPWRELVLNGTFSDATLSTTRVPLAYLVDSSWVALLEKSAAAHGSTWLHDLLLGVAYAEAGESDRPKQLFSRVLNQGKVRSPIAARCLAVLQSDPELAWANLQLAWDLAVAPAPSGESPDVTQTLLANLADERARLCLGLLGPKVSSAQVDRTSVWVSRLQEVVGSAGQVTDILKYSATVLQVVDGVYSTAIETLSTSCFPTFGRARDQLGNLWYAAQLGKAESAAQRKLTPVESHKLRKQWPIPQNIGCAYATLFCENYW